MVRFQTSVFLLWRAAWQLQASWTERAGNPRPDSTIRLVIEGFPAATVLTTGTASELTGRTFQAANLAISRLMKAGAMVQVNVGRRNRAFEDSELIEAFTSLERQLASPDGDTRISPPARPVPVSGDPHFTHAGSRKNRKTRPLSDRLAGPENQAVGVSETHACHTVRLGSAFLWHKGRHLPPRTWPRPRPAFSPVAADRFPKGPGRRPPKECVSVIL